MLVVSVILAAIGVATAFVLHRKAAADFDRALDEAFNTVFKGN